MQLDIVNSENKKVGAIDVRDEVFGGRVNTDLMWESVVHANAAVRRGTHATKNRANVSGSGKKPWKQKGTGRARVGSVRNPLWRHGLIQEPDLFRELHPAVSGERCEEWPTSQKRRSPWPNKSKNK